MDTGSQTKGVQRDHALRAKDVAPRRYPTTMWLPAGEVPEDLHNKAARYDAGDDVRPQCLLYLAQLDRLLENYGGDRVLVGAGPPAFMHTAFHAQGPAAAPVPTP